MKKIIRKLRYRVNLFLYWLLADVLDDVRAEMDDRVGEVDMAKADQTDVDQLGMEVRDLEKAVDRRFEEVESRLPSCSSDY